MVRVGILALQGDFEAHRKQLSSLGASVFLIKKPAELAAVSGLVIPGGESTTLLRLLDRTFSQALTDASSSGMPILATCAGLILIAKHVADPEQESLGILDVDVSRNAYGRQIDSFIEPNLTWTASGEKLIRAIETSSFAAARHFEGVFIRAPKITRVGETVSVLIERDTEPVLVNQGSIFAATFHPELSDNARVVQQLFLHSI